ncbi:MAG: type IV toxin-antitoxin system AbiEi family antitoxin domain-containing protein [Eubacteriales bacterium]|nr:type IV toxin-antitoxin system AbiEi family antitoxin domain-containing protein [Eubacteriales bacterium]
MNDSMRILEMANQNNGVVTAAMVTQAGISSGVLKYLSDNGKLEKSARGIYILPEIWEDEFVNLQGR